MARLAAVVAATVTSTESRAGSAVTSPAPAPATAVKVARQGRLAVVLQKVPSEFHPKVRNHGEGPY